MTRFVTFVAVKEDFVAVNFHFNHLAKSLVQGAEIQMTNREIMERRLNLYLEAEEKILLNQSYTLGNRTYVRANLSEVRAMIAELTEALNEGTGRRRFAVFKDR